MFKKIRCFYWSMRDQGKGRQVIVFAFILCLAMILIVGLGARSILLSESNKKSENTNHESTDNPVTGAGIWAAATATAVEASVEPQETTTPPDISVDTTGMESFLGFMSDDSYTGMKEQMVAICRERQCSSVKKLTYQQTKEGSFDVVSFILLSDGCVYQCDYNLKSGVFQLVQTTYTEADINTMKESEELAEQEALKKKQAADKKKAKKSAKKKTKSKK